MMRRHTKLLLALALLVLASCGKKVNIPEGVLPPEKMTPVLWDLIRADEVVTHDVRTDSLLTQSQKSIRVYQQVLALHGTDKNTFRKSLEYYQQNPDVFQVVLDSLQRRSDSAIIRKVEAVEK